MIDSVGVAERLCPQLSLPIHDPPLCSLQPLSPSPLPPSHPYTLLNGHSYTVEPIGEGIIRLDLSRDTVRLFVGMSRSG